MSWKPQVKVIGRKDEDHWSGNGLRFATKEEAEASAANLAARWILAEDHRAIECDDPVQHRWDEERGLVFVPLPLIQDTPA